MFFLFAAFSFPLPYKVALEEKVLLEDVSMSLKKDFIYICLHMFRLQFKSEL